MYVSAIRIYPDDYIQYLVEFHVTRDYFECHELLEEFWKEQPGDDPLYDTWVGLIQIAVSQYHHRRSNRRGARLLLEQALERLTAPELRELGLDGRALIQLLQQRLALLSDPQHSPAYADYDLPFADPDLLAMCQERAAAAGVRWGDASRMDDAQLIHRHTLRDRSGVIEARQAALARRRQRRTGRAERAE